MKMKKWIILRISILTLLLVVGMTNAYSLSVDVTDNPQIKDPVTVSLNMTYNTTANETAAHECYISIYATVDSDAPVRVYRYNAIVPELANLKTNEAGQTMFQFRTNDFEYIVHKEYTVWALCAGVSDSDIFVLESKDEGFWLLNTALGMNANIDNIIGAIFVLFGLSILILIFYTTRILR